MTTRHNIPALRRIIYLTDAERIGGDVLLTAQREYLAAEKLGGKGEYVVTETPDDPSLNPVWIGWAYNPVDALSRAAQAEGFAGYRFPENEDEVFNLCGWRLDDTVGATAVFTNTQWYSLPTGNEGEPPAFIGTDDTCRECGEVLLTLTSDVDETTEVVCPTHGSVRQPALYVAQMNTEHFSWTAVGATPEAAMDVMAEAFLRSLGDDAAVFWPDGLTGETLNDEYGILVLGPLVDGAAWRDDWAIPAA